jgi:hypothetical protein
VAIIAVLCGCPWLAAAGDLTCWSPPPRETWTRDVSPAAPLSPIQRAPYPRVANAVLQASSGTPIRKLGVGGRRGAPRQTQPLRRRRSATGASERRGSPRRASVPAAPAAGVRPAALSSAALSSQPPDAGASERPGSRSRERRARQRSRARSPQGRRRDDDDERKAALHERCFERDGMPSAQICRAWCGGRRIPPRRGLKPPRDSSMQHYAEQAFCRPKPTTQPDEEQATRVERSHVPSALLAAPD